MNKHGKVAHFGQMGQASRVKDAYDLFSIRALKVRNVQVVAAADNNVHLVVMHDAGEFRIPMDARSAKGMALLLTTSALGLEPEPRLVLPGGAAA